MGQAASTIPLEVLMKIEAHRPDLASLIHELAAATGPEAIRALERRLAAAYLSGVSALDPEQDWRLSACLEGRPYGAVAKDRLH